MKRRWIVLISVVSVLVLCAIIGTVVFLTSAYDGDEDAYIYIYDDYDADVVTDKLREAGVRATAFRLLASYDYNVRSGRYVVHRGDNILMIYRRLRSGEQVAVNLMLPSVRTMDSLAALLGRNLMIDSLSFATAFADTAYIARYGYTCETLPALFIPNTYQLYWNISLDKFMQRMKRENANYWNSARDAAAKEIGLSHVEVATLASIIDEETANNEEKPTIAGLYLNRLRKGMLLEADPTVKFANADFALRRILKRHLMVDNPYNTYKYPGLPPGPIRIPSVAGMDAVLHYEENDYLFMCAKEDFSGTHNFAKTLGEHLQNARRYQKALNARNIR